MYEGQARSWFSIVGARIPLSGAVLEEKWTKVREFTQKISYFFNGHAIKRGEVKGQPLGKNDFLSLFFVEEKF